MDPARRHRILGLALPIIVGMVSQNLLNIVDTAMVGFLGDSALAAVGVGGFVVLTCQALILGISTGVQSTASRRVGEGRADRAVNILNTALLLIVIVAPLFSLAIIQVAPTLFPFLNSDATVVERGIPYLEWRLGAMVFVGINFVFRGYWNARDMSRVYMTTLITMHSCNIFLNYVLIFGKLGAPAYGVTGAGMASAISMAIGSAIYVALAWKYSAKDGFLRALSTREETSSLVRISLPSGMQQTFFFAGMVVMFWILGRIGTAEVAAANVLITVMLFALLPGLALGLASATLVGQALGRKEPDDAYRWAWDVAKVSTIVMSVLGLPMWLAPDLVSAIFIHDLDTRELARWPMRLVGLTMPVEAMVFTFMHSLLGAGDARRVMLIGISSQWLLFLPLAWLFGAVLGFGLFTIWLLLGCSRTYLGASYVTMWHRRGWQRIVV